MSTNPFLTAVYKEPDETLLKSIKAAVEKGSDPNGSGEAPILRAFRRGRMDAVALLIEYGADARNLGLSPLHEAVAFGTLENIRKLLSSGDLSARSYQGLTPFLLAVHMGDTERAALLLPVSAREDTYRTREAEPALVIATGNKHLDMVQWLLANGFDVNEPAEFGLTPLIEAASINSPAIVEVLLEAGARIDAADNISASLRKSSPEKYANDDHKTIHTASSVASSAVVARMLMKHGAELCEFGGRVTRELIGSRLIPAQQITPEIFHAQKHRRFGTANPEPVVHEYWLEAIRGKAGGYYGRRDFGIAERELPAIWSYDRFGMTTTELPDGRWVQIAGEHEDHYDPDFCIYSDVFVFDGKGGVQIYIYPREVFPPTDFHTATLVKDEIILIGNLGYAEDRQANTTQVMRLNLEDFSISRVQTAGATPGWVSRHRARLVGDKIEVSGGEIWTGYDLIPNEKHFRLCLSYGIWAASS